MKVKEVIVVEGRDDTAKIKQTIDADTIETNGSALDETTIETIRHAQAKRGVIVFTDPDSPGKQIRHLIAEAVPGCKHAFLEQGEARDKHRARRSLGIEHASGEVIKNALSAVYELDPAYETDITRQDLMAWGLISGPEAAQQREKVGNKLRIGHTNGKQLLKRLSMFQIDKQKLQATMQVIEQEEQSNGDQ